MKAIVFQFQHQVNGLPREVKNLLPNYIEIENSGYSLAGFDLFKSEILAELRIVKYNDLEDTV